MREKADLKERLEELEHRCIQLSGETDTIGMFRQHKQHKLELAQCVIWGLAFGAGASQIPSSSSLLLLPS